MTIQELAAPYPPLLSHGGGKDVACNPRERFAEYDHPLRPFRSEGPTSSRIGVVPSQYLKTMLFTHSQATQSFAIRFQ